MNTTVEGFKGPDTPETGLKKSSSLDVKKEQENQDIRVKDRKINDILNKIDKPDEIEQKYKEKLLNLDNKFLEQLLQQNVLKIEETLQKSPVDIQKDLIQAQIDELDKKGNLTSREKFKKIKLNKQLIALENNKQAEQDKLIALEKQETKKEKAETQARYAELVGELRSIKGSLYILENRDGISAYTQKTLDFLKIFEGDKFSPDNIKNITDEDLNDLRKQKEKFLNDLKQNPAILYSIVKDLQEYDKENGTKTYENFKSIILEIDSSIDFSKANMVGNLAKAKLGTTDLSGVDLESNVLSKTEDGVRTSYSKDEGRYLSSTGEGKYKIESEINPKYEEEITEINGVTKEKLAPLNESLDLVSKVLEYLKNARQNGEDFEEVKRSIQEQNPDFYAEEGLDNITSFDEMMMILNARKYELEEEKEEIKSEAIERMDELLRQNQEEIDEKEKHKKEMLRFFSAIGFDRLSQTETDKLIELVNLNTGSYGLDGPIDLENGDLGFNKDFGDKRISPTEKLAFVKFFNKMLGEDVVRIDEKLQTIIPLDSSDENKLQKLSNKKVGFFMGNLNKESTSNESKK